MCAPAGSIRAATQDRSRVVGYPSLIGKVRVSSPGESHPEALAELYVSLSTHTAPIMEPRRAPICQWANNSGAEREMRAIQCVALRSSCLPVVPCTENEVSVVRGIPPRSICERNEILGKFVLYFVVLIKGIGELRD